MSPSPRQPAHAVATLFTERTSPRSFTGETLPLATLFSILEAARWAPSSSNVQPWRFVYGLRETPQWGPIFDTLMPFNQIWVAQASALVVLVSDIQLRRGGTLVVSPTHSFDTGAAWLSLALQAHLLGWAAHAMGGFVSETARLNLRVPEGFHIDTVVAIGRQGPADALPPDLAAREMPSLRRPLAESLMHGAFVAG